MPFYDYQCPACDAKQEFSHSIFADVIFQCKCGEADMKKCITAPPVHFKGSGFYVNDYPKAKS